MGSHCFKGNLCHYVSNEVTYWSQLSVKSDLMRLFFTRFLVCKLMSTYMYKSIRSKTKMKLNLLTCSLARSLLVFLTVMWYFPLLWLAVEVTFRFDFCNWPLLLLQNDSWEKLENATKKKKVEYLILFCNWWLFGVNCFQFIRSTRKWNLVLA